MTEALIAELSRISGLDKVISRRSVMQFKGSEKPLPEIASTLGVEGVIEGSVTAAEGRVRITVQLIEGATDRHLWVEEYERAFRDLLALQREVARAITRQVQVELTPAEETRLAAEGQVEPEAYDAYLRGLHELAKGTEEGFRAAIGYFEQAIDRHPTFAAPYATLARALFQADVITGRMTIRQRGPTAGGLPDAAEARRLVDESSDTLRIFAQRALELDPTNAEAHVVLGNALGFLRGDRSFALREDQRAIELDPGFAYAHCSLSYSLGFLGRYEDALAAARRCLELDPLYATSRLAVADRLRSLRRFDEAAAEYHKVLEMEPGLHRARRSLATVYADAGRYREAGEVFRELIRRNAPDAATAERELRIFDEAFTTASREAFYGAWVAWLEDRLERGLPAAFADASAPGRLVARVYAGAGRLDRALEWLEYHVESGVAPIWLDAPVWDPFRSDPRFVALADKAGLGPDGLPR